MGIFGLKKGENEKKLIQTIINVTRRQILLGRYNRGQ
jgi:hypothetical protein